MGKMGHSSKKPRLIPPTPATMTRGIELADNSCYMDATLFSMFYRTRVFDPLLLNHDETRKGDIRIVTQLCKIVRDNLRSANGYCAASHVGVLRELLAEHRNPRMRSAMMDVDELIQMLFSRGLDLPPFIEYTNKKMNFLHQLLCTPFDWRKGRLRVADVETCLVNSMTNNKLTFKQVPSPALFIKMPRWGSDLQGFDGIVPNLSLDITATCYEEFENSGQNLSMSLHSVICWRNYHYTTYVRRVSKNGSIRWAYFNSLGPHVIEPLQGLEEQIQDMCQDLQSDRPIRRDQLISDVNRMISDIHVCIYIPFPRPTPASLSKLCLSTPEMQEFVAAAATKPGHADHLLYVHAGKDAVNPKSPIELSSTDQNVLPNVSRKNSQNLAQECGALQQVHVPPNLGQQRDPLGDATDETNSDTTNRTSDGDLYPPSQSDPETAHLPTQRIETGPNDYPNLSDSDKIFNTNVIHMLVKSVVFGTTVFDRHLLQGHWSRDAEKASVLFLQRILKTMIESVRTGGHVGQKDECVESILKFFELEKSGVKADMCDLFCQLFDALELDAFIEYSGGGDGALDFIHRMRERPYASEHSGAFYSKVPTLGQLVANEEGRINLKRLPEPALLIKMPMKNGKMVGYDGIVPSQSINVFVQGMEFVQMKLCAVICLRPSSGYEVYVKENHPRLFSWVKLGPGGDQKFTYSSVVAKKSLSTGLPLIDHLRTECARGKFEPPFLPISGFSFSEATLLSLLYQHPRYKILDILLTQLIDSGKKKEIQNLLIAVSLGLTTHKYFDDEDGLYRSKVVQLVSLCADGGKDLSHFLGSILTQKPFYNRYHKVGGAHFEKPYFVHFIQNYSQYRISTISKLLKVPGNSLKFNTTWPSPALLIQMTRPDDHESRQPIVPDLTLRMEWPSSTSSESRTTYLFDLVAVVCTKDSRGMPGMEDCMSFVRRINDSSYSPSIVEVGWVGIQKSHSPFIKFVDLTAKIKMALNTDQVDMPGDDGLGSGVPQSTEQAFNYITQYGNLFVYVCAQANQARIEGQVANGSEDQVTRVVEEYRHGDPFKSLHQNVRQPSLRSNDSHQSGSNSRLSSPLLVLRIQRQSPSLPSISSFVQGRQSDGNNTFYASAQFYKGCGLMPSTFQQQQDNSRLTKAHALYMIDLVVASLLTNTRTFVRTLEPNFSFMPERQSVKIFKNYFSKIICPFYEPKTDLTASADALAQLYRLMYGKEDDFASIVDMDGLFVQIFKHCLNLKFFIHYTNDKRAFIHQAMTYATLPADESHSRCLSTQTLMNESCTVQNLVLGSAPRSFFIVKMPYHGKSLVGCGAVVPSPVLLIRCQETDGVKEVQLTLHAIICVGMGARIFIRGNEGDCWLEKSQTVINEHPGLTAQFNMHKFQTTVLDLKAQVAKEFANTLPLIAMTHYISIYERERIPPKNPSSGPCCSLWP